MLRWITAALDSLGAFVRSESKRNQLMLTFGIPAVGVFLGGLSGILAGNTGVRIFCYIFLPVVAILLLSGVWHEVRNAQTDDRER